MIDLFNICSHFKIEGEIKSIEPYGNGHINKTFLVCTNKKRYILQQINTIAFKDVDLLMNNIYLVTDYMRSIKQESMVVIKTKDDNLYYRYEDGYFRIYEFVEHTSYFDEITDYSLIDKDAEAFAKLHRDLANFDASKLGETILNFHNTPIRYKNFLDAINLDKFDRKKTCLKEIEEFKKYENKLSLIMDGLNDGSIRYCTTHNDPKINNVLFDSENNDVRCVIDLDTIMPGSILFDIGDSLRSLFTGKNEDTENLSSLVVNYEIFEHYVSNYLKINKNIMTKKEIELIPYSAFLLSFECGIRFLEDYLRGDIYFHIKKENHNLLRARTQLALAQNIYNSFDKLAEIIHKYE